MKYWFIVLMVIFFKADVSAQLTYETLRIVYDTPWVYKNLKLIPVRFKPKDPPAAALLPSEPKLVSLADAMQKKMVKVKELKTSQGSDVNTLEVVNTSKQPILINSGEMLAGGKQDRMVGETKLIMPGKEKQFLKVFCIEKGRWDNKAKKFKHRGRASAELKKTMDKTNRQARVWKEIDKAFATQKEKSVTSAYLKIFNDSLKADTGYINFFTRKYRQSDSAFAGFIAITGDQVISTELYASTLLTQVSFPSILKTFVLAAIKTGSKPVMTDTRVSAFTDQFLINEKIQKAYLSQHGKIHSANNKVVHITAYDD